MIVGRDVHRPCVRSRRLDVAGRDATNGRTEPLPERSLDVPGAQASYEGGARKRIVYLHDPEANLLEVCSYEVPVE